VHFRFADDLIEQLAPPFGGALAVGSRELAVGSRELAVSLAHHADGQPLRPPNASDG